MSQASNFNDLKKLYVDSIAEFSRLLPSSSDNGGSEPRALVDTYESNDTMSTATSVSLGSSYGSYISTSSDLDYFKVYTGSGFGTLNFQLHNK